VGGSLTGKWLHPDAAGQLSVELLIELDSQQLGLIRGASRDPILIRALLTDARLTLRRSILFTRSLDVMAMSISKLQVADYEISPARDKPAWLPSFLHRLSGVFFRHSADLGVEEIAMRAATSLDDYDNYRRWQEALSRYGQVRIATDGWGQPLLMAGERPLHRFGLQAVQDASVAAAIYLSGAEIVWVDGPVGFSGLSDFQILSASEDGEITLSSVDERGPVRFAAPER